MERDSHPAPKRDMYPIFYPPFAAVLATRFNQHVTGEENIISEPAVFAANHLRFEDSLLLAGAYTHHTGRPMRFGAKREYFDGEGIPVAGKMRFGRAVRFFMEHSRMIPIDRDNGRRALEDLNHYAGIYLQDGDAIALHPEGTRSEDGRLHKFKSGAARIAIKNHVPIVPVGFVYGDKDRIGRRHVDIHFGTPIGPEEHWGLPLKQRSEIISDELERRVAAMTGQERSQSFGRLRVFKPESDESAL